MSAATVSRWARRFVLASAAFLLAWHLGALLGAPRRTLVALALYGFVLHVVFGKAYSLVPSYFDRQLAVPRAPSVHLPLTVAGAAGLAAAPLDGVPASVGAVGAVAWALGVAVFLGALGWTVRDNLTGSETGTGEPNADRRPVDRLANAFVPVVLLYLALGTLETVALHTSLPSMVGGPPARVTHLLAAGVAALLIFAVGFRLLPRFLVASPPRPLVALVLPAGAVGPALLAGTLGGGWAFRLAAVVEAVAVVGFAAAYVLLFHRSDRRRVGFYGVYAGVASGVLAVLLGLSFAFGSFAAGAVTAHLRLNLLGFLGLTVVGVAYQFYPPAAGTFRGAGDRTALVSLACLAGGLGLQVLGLLGVSDAVTTLGEAVALAGAGLYAYLLVRLFHER